MDFLDPKHRAKHRRMLIAGYILTFIAIILSTLALVAWASGVRYNTSTGKISENGLLFLDSQPSGASVYLNGQARSKTTAARLDLSAGSYDILLKKAGYSDWQHKVVLSGGSVERIVYPFLFPKDMKPQNLRSYTESPNLITESPDRHWLLVQSNNSAASFDEFDTSKTTPVPVSLAMPTGLLSGSEPGNLDVVEWSNDNDHLLLKHSFAGGSEFIMFNRADPASSYNVNSLFNTNPTSVALLDKKASQIYLFNQSSGDLLLGDVGRKQAQPLLKSVISFKSVGSGQVVYLTSASSNQLATKIWDGSRSYQLNRFPKIDQPVADAILFQSHWYVAVSSDVSGRVNIYKDPLDSLKDPSKAKASPLISLVSTGTQTLSISLNGRFIASQAGTKLSIYDIEDQTRFQYNLDFAPPAPLTWMDGHRLLSVKNGQMYVVDFDGQNPHNLLPVATDKFLFDRDYTHLYSLLTAPDGGSTLLQTSDLRAGVDLPKQ